MKITRLRIENFKGVKYADYNFYDTTFIYGKNGSGKTTIADAICWTFTNKNIDEVSNPNIRNYENEDLTPRVTIDFIHNDIEHTIEKIQKLEVKEQGGVTTSRTQNTFTLDGITKTQANIQNNLTEMGIDLKKYHLLTNLNAFLSQKSADMRNDLMLMVSDISDLDIALKKQDCFDLAELLKKHSLESIVASAKGTIRKLKDTFGKNGEIIDAKIEGLEISKHNGLPIEELEKQKNQLENEINALKLKNNTNENEIASETALKKMLEDLKHNYLIKRREIYQNAYMSRTHLLKDKTAQEDLEKRYTAKVKWINSEVERYQKNIADITADIEKLETTKISIDKNCPYCKQALPKDMLDAVKKNAENERAKKIEELKKQIESYNIAKSNLVEQAEIYKNSLEDVINKLNEINSELEKIPKFANEKEVSYENNEELKKLYQSINSNQEKLNAILEQNNPIDDEKLAIFNAITEKENELNNINNSLTLAKNDLQIDERIKEYQEQKLEMAKSRVYAEKILYQADELNKTKNEVFVTEINSHFKKVEWKLFDYQKNGEYKAVCEPIINGKSYNDCANNSLRVEAQVDILNSLQNFNNQDLPIIIDNAEMLDNHTQSLITSEHQLIFLNVSNLDDELRIEGKEN